MASTSGKGHQHGSASKSSPNHHAFGDPVLAPPDVLRELARQLAPVDHPGDRQVAEIGDELLGAEASGGNFVESRRYDPAPLSADADPATKLTRGTRDIKTASVPPKADVGEDEMNLLVGKDTRGFANLVDGGNDVVARLGEEMLVVECDQRLVLNDENSPDQSFTLTEQHLGRCSRWSIWDRNERRAQQCPSVVRLGVKYSPADR